MKRLRSVAALLLLTLVGGLLLFASPQTTTKAQKRTNPSGKAAKTTRNNKTIYVYPKENCDVDSATLKAKKKQDTVRWKYDPHTVTSPGTITFLNGPTPTSPKTPCVENGAPKNPINMPGGSHFSETCSVGDVDIGEYKYVVEIPGTCKGPDPSVDVHN
jgi:hypothetical protein